MGYSDITNLHVALLRGAGLATFHGPGFGSMGIPERTAYTWDSALEAFAKGGVGPVPPDPDDPYRRTIAPGRVTAPLVGGNLWTFTHLLGTPWEPTFEGAILLWEEVHTPAYQLEVLLTQLRLAGKLDGLAGRRGRRAGGLRLERAEARSAPEPFHRRCSGAAPSAARASRCYTGCLLDTASTWRRSPSGCAPRWTRMPGP